MSHQGRPVHVKVCCIKLMHRGQIRGSTKKPKLRKQIVNLAEIEKKFINLAEMEGNLYILWK